ncbi:RHS repeat-associated core domain-containing protein [Shewanella maritima]|uniref:RHS repeat-associated core domain-containing protein n=1 Tax=Shewanella maritima TaxID=2520507 RepID=UPI003736161C
MLKHKFMLFLVSVFMGTIYSLIPVTANSFEVLNPPTLNGEKTNDTVYLDWYMGCAASSVVIQESNNRLTWNTVYTGSGSSDSGSIGIMSSSVSPSDNLGGGCVGLDLGREVVLHQRTNTGYFYRIKVCSSSFSCGQFGDPIQVGYFGEKPATPATITVPSFNNDGVFEVSWTSGGLPLYGEYFQLEQQVNGLGWEKVLDRSTVRDYEVRSFSSKQFKHRVRACTQVTCSDWKVSSTTTVDIDEDNWKNLYSVDVEDADYYNNAPSEQENITTHTLNLKLGVTGGQSATSLPVLVPPGRNNIRPQVGISYNSQSGNGLLGVGFSLAASSSIQRCKNTHVNDRNSLSVTFGDDDKLCLSGQRLMIVSGHYGHSGAIYRTEIDNFSRVTQFGDLGSGNVSFSVETQNGTKSFYGTSQNARLSPVGVYETLEWKLSKTTDSGEKNSIDYVYDKSVHGESLLRDIYYTGNGNSYGDRKIRFNYESRDDKRVSYLYGGKLVKTRRLSSIETYLSNQKYSSYEFDYEYSQASNRSLLTNLQQCINGNCTSPIALNWLDKRHFNNPEPIKVSGEAVFEGVNWLNDFALYGDFDGNGSRDFLGYSVDAEQRLNGTNSYESDDICYREWVIGELICQDADFNLDGITDKVRLVGGFIKYIDSETNALVNTNVKFDKTEYYNGRYSRLVSISDLNGDGYVDIVIDHAKPSQVKAYINRQGIFDTSGKVILDHTYIDGRITTNVVVVNDIDGNGLPDFLHSNSYSKIYNGLSVNRPISFILNNSTSDNLNFSQLDVESSFSSSFEPGYFSYFIDVNGDGLRDWLEWIDGEGILLRVNYGGGNFSEQIQTDINIPTRTYQVEKQNSPGEPVTVRVPYHDESLFHVVDIDGDGINEFVYPSERLVTGCSEVINSNKLETRCGSGLYDSVRVSTNTVVTSLIDVKSRDDSIYKFKAIKFYLDENGSFSTEVIDTPFIGSATQSAFVDYFGDGNIDFVFAYGARGSHNSILNPEKFTYGGEGAYIVRNYGSGSGNGSHEYGPVDYLDQVVDELGNETQWAYKPLSTGEPSAGQTLLNKTDHSSIGSGYIHFASSMYVVQSFKQSNGQGGSNETQYAYKGAMYNLQGRGFTGFNQIWEKDMQRGKTVHSTFKQQFPETGLLTKQTVKVGSRLISQTDNTWKDNPAHNISGVESRYLHKSINQTWDLNGVRLAKTQTVVNDADIDAYSNIERRVNYHWDYFGTQSNRYVSVESADYVPSESNWWINKYNFKKVWYGKVIRNWSDDPYTGSDVSSWQTTTVNTWDSTHRKPTKATVTASGIGSSCNRVEEASYNTYGMPNWVQVSGRSSSCGSLPVRKTQFTYTKNGTSAAADGYLPFVVTNAKGHKATTHYDMGLGLPVKVIDPNNLVTTTQYDGAGRPIEVTSTGKPTQYLRYLWANEVDNQPFTVNTAKTVVRVTAAGQPTTEKYADSLGREVRIATQGFDGGYQYVDKHYDALGRLTKESTPYGNGSSAEYTQYFNFDALDRPGSRSIPNGTSGGLTSAYTYYGTRTDIDVEGRSMSRTYGAGGLLYETVDAKGGTNRFAYDGAKRPLVIQDANKQNIIASYNGFGHKTKVIDPNQGTTLFGYNTFGELDKQTDANGVVQTFTVDQLGRISQKKVTGGNAADTSTYTWDTVKKGLLTSEKNSDVTRTYGYNTRSQLTSMTVSVNGISHTIKHQYDGFYGRPKALEYPNGLTLKYGYNDFGYLESTSNAASGYVYRHVTDMDEKGHITGAQLGNQVMTQTNLYNPEGTLNYTKVDTALGLIHAHYYNEYDSFMNIKDEHNGVTGLRKQYNYDTLNRLKTYTFSNNNPTYTATVNYDYDSVGNFLKKTDYSANIANAYRYGVETGCSTSQNAGPNAICRLTKLNGSNVSFHYDKRGNLLTGDGLSLVYNEMDKPISINRSGTTTTFRYGSDGMRVKQTRSSDNVTTYYVDKLYEADSDGSWRAYIEDVAVMSYTAKRKHLLHFTLKDRLGSATTLADHSGIIITQRYFDPFGRAANLGVRHKEDMASKNATRSKLADLDITNRYRRGFTDHEHMNEQQLIHMNGRVYDYNMGRFMSVDPFIQSPTSTQSVNPYSYIMNNPLAGTDPTGYVAEEKEFKIKVATTGSRIKRSVTATVSSNGKGGATVTFSGGNGASRSAAKNAVAGKLSAAGFKVSDIGGQSNIAQSASNNDNEGRYQGSLQDQIKQQAHEGIQSVGNDLGYSSEGSVDASWGSITKDDSGNITNANVNCGTSCQKVAADGHQFNMSRLDLQMFHMRKAYYASQAETAKYQGAVLGGILGGALAVEGVIASRAWLSVAGNAKKARKWCSAFGIAVCSSLTSGNGGKLTFEVPSRGGQIFRHREAVRKVRESNTVESLGKNKLKRAR